MWSLEFVEVADDELMTKKLSDKSDDADTGSRDTADVDEKSMSRPLDIPSSSVSNRHANVSLVEYSSSVDSDTGHMQCAVENWLSAEKQCGDDTAPTSPLVDSDRRQHSRDVSTTDAAAAAVGGELFAMDDEESTPLNNTAAITSQFRSSAKLDSLSSVPTFSIDTPESGDFCFVTEQDISDSQLIATGLQRRVLRDGFHWQKQLVFRSKLTMHTAFERKDNKDPAAVTSLAVSRYQTSHFTYSLSTTNGRRLCMIVLFIYSFICL